MKRATPIFIAILVASVITVIFLSSRIFYTIQPGHQAIVFKPFSGGLDTENIFSDGFHIVAPWNRVIVYDVREQPAEEQMDVLDKNGLSISVDVSVRFRPFSGRIGELHNRFGENYRQTLVIPEIRSAVREVMGRFTADEIYSTKRPEVSNGIEKMLAESLSDPQNNVEMTAMLIRSIRLPEQIRIAIENKQRQEQELLSYQFRLETERKEAERKELLALGEAKANQIINNSLTDNLLRMRGIEATRELANSENSKVIVIGSGDDGLPIILGNN